MQAVGMHPIMQSVDLPAAAHFGAFSFPCNGQRFLPNPNPQPEVPQHIVLHSRFVRDHGAKCQALKLITHHLEQ